MKNERAVAVRRLLAFAVDWLVVVVWGGVLFGAVMIATSGNPTRLENPWKAQAIGLLTMTVPVTFYFALCESSALQASFGKRVLGLVVCRETGERLLFRSALLRNTVKFVPWEFGHTVAQQAAFSGEGGFPAWVWGPATVALLGPLWWLVAMIATGRTPYDRCASARVARSADHEPRFEPPSLAAQRNAAAGERRGGAHDSAPQSLGMHMVAPSIDEFMALRQLGRPVDERFVEWACSMLADEFGRIRKLCG